MNTLRYILTHAWLWPLRFYLRPLDVIQDAEDNQRKWSEVFCAMLGGAVWGALSGVLLWLGTGNFEAVWILAVVGAIAFAIASAFAISSAISISFAIAFTSAIAIAIAFAIAISSAIGSGSARDLAFASAIGSAIASGMSSTLNFAIAIAIIRAIARTVGSTIGSTMTLSFSIAFAFAIAFTIAFTIAFAFAITIASTFSGTELFTLLIKDILPIILTCVIMLGWVTGFFYVKKEHTGMRIYDLVNTKILSGQTTKQSDFLLLLLFGSVYALGLWRWNFELPRNLEIPPDIIEILPDVWRSAAYKLLWLAPFLSALPLYPFAALITLWQSRNSCALRCSPKSPRYFQQILPLNWQTFAWPLPGIRTYLVKVARFHGVAEGFEAIQTIQLKSLQVRAARLAACDLASDQDTALAFCGHLALHTNTITLAPLALTGPVGRAVTVLAKKPEKEHKQPLRLYVGKYPPKKFFFFFISAHQRAFRQARQADLAERLDYARQQIASLQDFAHAQEFEALLKALYAYITVKSTREMLLSESKLQLGQAEAWTPDAAEPLPWLAQGWQMLSLLRQAMQTLENYPDLGTPTARKQFLLHQRKQLANLDWSNLSDYWGNLGREIATHWLEILDQESREAREWLHLELTLPENYAKTGAHSLNLALSNPTGVLAQNIRIVLEPSASEQLYWRVEELKHQFLEGGRHISLPLPFECREPGEYPLRGEVQAEDLSGIPVRLPFSFRLHIDTAGKPYSPPEIWPYFTGEGLPNDATFAGRGELLRWLRGLWLKPEGKPAVLLVGQRRIGKTSLLNKIQRDGLADTGLLPVKVDMQHCTSAYHFLSLTAKNMARQLEQDPPVLDKAEPYADFSEFLDRLTPVLDGRRFLLMLDEADLLPARNLGELLPGFLRSLMQGAEYPVLLLFCGTYTLKRMGREYQSILFNTAQVRTVSYLDPPASAEVLVKPSQGIFEFDKIALDSAYQLTRGQPLLLQLLGTILIRQFNRRYWGGEKPDNFVGLNEMEHAARALVEEETNMAFENHWADSDVQTHRLLSALAWRTDERDRPQVDIDGLEAALRETRLELPRHAVVAILERLGEEEILESSGPTYRYAVPLYRRWVLWKHGPERVRVEAVDENFPMPR